MIHLGYETGTGRPVSIPLAHMAVTGMTQQSGKTVTMESLIDRGELRAVVFVTKPGEKSFTKGRKILPFFKERADWEYVKELLEARRNESLSKWDGYLMRACRRARTLQDVRNNVEAELPKKKSARPSHYEVLAGYLDLIIPELERVPYTDKLELEHGVNIMDLTKMSDDMKNMVIRSTIQQIHAHEHNSVLVMPEAWKFIPEGGRSAVFSALQSLVREGATNGNFVWIDAQDLAIVSKRILKSVSVWVLGKQQEANEVARTINHLIEPLQIRPDMIKSLGIGQFLVCADSHPARRVYVQPWWLGELDALAIARGEESVETAQAIFRQKKRQMATQIAPSLPGKVTRVSLTTPRQVQILEQTEPVKHEETKAENQSGLVGGIPRLEGTPVSSGGRVGPDRDDSDTQPREQTENGSAAPRSGRIVDEDVSPDADSEDETMWKERAEKAEAEVISLRADVANLRKMLNDYRGVHDPGPNGGGADVAAVIDADPGAEWWRGEGFEKFYAYLKSRAGNDPGILQLLASRPELRVQIETPVLEVKENTLRGGLAHLIHKGFFSTPKNGNTTFNELQRLGKRTPKPNVYRELDNLAELGFLTKELDGFLATDLKVSVKRGA